MWKAIPNDWQSIRWGHCGHQSSAERKSSSWHILTTTAVRRHLGHTFFLTFLEKKYFNIGVTVSLWCYSTRRDIFQRRECGEVTKVTSPIKNRCKWLKWRITNGNNKCITCSLPPAAETIIVFPQKRDDAWLHYLTFITEISCHANRIRQDLMLINVVCCSTRPKGRTLVIPLVVLTGSVWGGGSQLPSAW